MSGRNEQFTVGTAEIEITPPVGALMSCFPEGLERKPRRSQGVHDPLKAKAVAISDFQENICLCSCDLTMIRTIDMERVRKIVERDVPELSGHRVIIAATHTHSSAENCYIFGNTPNDPWIKKMDYRIAETIVQAFRNRMPASVSFGKSEIDFAFNRRVSSRGGKERCIWEYEEGEPTGLFDPELIVIRFDRKTKSPIAILANYTAHALTVGRGNFLYTADYPGAACFFVEKAFPGTMGLFFNGAAGNTHPRKCMRRDYKIMEEMGRKLGEEIIRVSKQTNKIDSPSISFYSDILDFPNRIDPSQRVKVEISLLALGPVIVGFIPGELFVEFQLMFKKNIEPHIGMIIGYANGWPGYIPVQKEYDLGGYGVDLYTLDPPQYSRTSLPKGAGEKIMERLLSFTHSLSSSNQGRSLGRV